MDVRWKYLILVFIPVVASQTSTSTCPPNYFRCPSGFCIPNQWLCDGDNDCGDISDERQDCPPVTCTDNQFSCSNGHCIPDHWQCDFDNDCGDNSDERSCSHPACTSSEFKCVTGQCIPEDQECDRIPQCQDLTDETNCTRGYAPCPYPQMQCTNGDCVHYTAWCNRYDDCSDRSDESSCVYPTCSGNQYTCDNGQCTFLSWVCDGIPDCMDGSDEQGCNATFSCGPQEYACPESDHQCIPQSKLCDGRADCPGRKDEQPGCNINNCGELGCSNQCRAAPYGGVCVCEDGFVIGSDNRTCTDFDECQAWGYCEQQCENAPGTFACSCLDGYLLESSGRCRSTASDVPYLMYAMGNEIIRSDLRGYSVQSLLGNIDPMDVDFHFSQNKIYWTDSVTNKVYRGNFIGGNQNPEVVISLEYISPEGIAVDWVGNNLYFLENQGDRIEVCKLDGSMRSTLIGNYLSSPMALVLDPTEGYLFFSDYGVRNDEEQQVRIERAYMDGSNRFDLVTEKLYWPSGLSVDIPSKRLYWVDSKLDLLESITYDGQFRQTILYGGTTIPSPHSLAVFESNVYFTDWTKLGVLSTNRFDLTQRVTPIDTSTNIKPNGIKVVHSSLQPAVTNPCGSDNGGCSHLCLVSHRTDNSGLGYQCTCPFGYQLQTDGLTCTKLDSFLFVYTPYSIRGIPLNPLNPTDAIDPIITSQYGLYDVTYDAAGENIIYSSRDYFYFRGAFNITSRKRDGTGKKSLYLDFIAGPGSIEYDWLSKTLYFADVTKNSISVMKIGDTYDANNVVLKMIVPNLISPWSMAVAPLDGYIFWTDTPNPTKIERAWLDGTNREVIVTAELETYLRGTLCVDHQDKRIYWTQSSELRRIERCDFDGSNRQQLNVNNLGNPFGVVVFQNYTYYSDMRDGKVYRVNKITGGQKRLISQLSSTTNYYRYRIKYYSADLQSGENGCSTLNRNGGCSHFCFGAPNGARTCGCPDGMKIARDQVTCEDDPSYVVPPPCRTWHFQCTEPSNQCIYRSYKCDGKEDCMDGSDEIDCGTPENPCSGLSINCDNGTCLNYQNRCDDISDCQDGTDEENCGTNEADCDEPYFYCTNNERCIHPRYLCDTNNDCGDAADEQNCEGYTCDDNHFSCETIQQCVPLYYVCNGYDNCGDNSDEQDCPQRNCTSYQFTCRSDGECIRLVYKCDGYNDCDDGSDELECPPPGSCNEGYFFCRASGNCLPESWICDGDEDCIDGSDEPTSCAPVTCPSWASFKCETRNRCISERWLCDSDNDCGDMSDERNCPSPPYRCPENTWQCPRTTICIPDDKVCDGQNDCPSGDDEGPMCNDDMCNLSNGGCSHTCLQTPHGAQCQCPDGMELNATKTCLDIDECNPPMYCSQLCINRRQSYECGCKSGYTLDLTNGQTCIADGDEGILLLSDRNRLFKKAVSSSTLSTVVNNDQGPSNIVSMDFNAEENVVYWGDSSTNRIWSTNIDGSNKTTIIDSGLDYSELAYDWVTHNLYWSDPYLQIIEVVSLDTLHRATILSARYLSSVRCLSLDPRNGKRYMFWANPAQPMRIERLSMDGTGITTLVSDKLYVPSGLALDLPNERVYFGDTRMDFIEFCDYNGNGRQQVVVSTQYLRGLRNLVVWEDYVYWVDSENQELLRANKLTGENVSVVLQNLNRPYDVSLFHPARQPAASNPCAGSPCQHLCLLSTNSAGYSCACGAGYKLNTDGVSCQESGPFLLYTALTPYPSILGRKLDPNDTSRNDMVQMTGSRDLYDIDFDMKDRYIYWTEARDHEHQNDRALNNIQRISLDGENRTAIVPSAFSGSPLTLSIDWVSRNIYWTNPASETIEVMKMDGDEFYRAVVLSNEGSQGGQLMGDPVALCVDPLNGMLYWADNSDSGVEPHLAKSKMDGSDPEVITSEEIDHVDYLIIDIPEQKLYWNDATYQRIERMNVDGTERTQLIDHVQHGRGLAIFQNYLYYSETGRQRITRVDKATGANPVVMVDFISASNRGQFHNSLSTGLRVYHRDGVSSNACSNNNGGCQHLCLPNGVNSRTCLCTTGYQLNEDGTTCSNVTSFAVVTLYYVIRGFGLDNGFKEAMVPCAGYQRTTMHVEAVMNLGYVYFADYENRGDKRHSIRRVRPDGSGLEDLVVGGGRSGLRGLAIDWIAGNMYFPNVYSYITYLEMSRLDGSNRVVLWKSVDEKPRTMTVNPIKKFLYWADYGLSPSITRAFLDASNRTDLITTGISIPRDICIDMATHKVYWVDSVTSTLERMDWDGANREYLHRDLVNPHGLAIFQNWVYWVDRSEGYIYRANKDRIGDTPEILKRDLAILRDIAIYDDSIQPEAPNNPCKVNNGGCDDLCVALPDGESQPFKCLCAYGVLGHDGTSCEDVDSYLVYAHTTDIRSVHLDETNYAMPFQPITGLELAVALDFDYDSQRIFFTDVAQDKIMSISASGSGTPVDVVTENVQSPEGIAVDYLHNRLYWTDQALDAIFSAEFSGQNRVKLLTADKPRAIVVDPCSGTLYWTDWGENPKIEKSTMGGRDRRTLVDTNLKWPNGLTIDYHENTIYWADGFYQVIERVTLNGTRRQVILDRATHPFAMTLFNNYVYYTDWELKAVIRVEKHTGANEVVMWRDPNGPRPMDIHVYDSSRQQQCSSSPCSNAYNGGCSEGDTCHPEPGGGVTCRCTREGTVPANENRICVPDTAQCGQDEFTCANGQCISWDWRCDLDNDCGDNSDESVNFCYDHTCTSTQVACDNGLCIPANYVCDFENDCGDNSDEQQDCGFPTCAEGDYTCPNSRCIPLEYLCDGEDDCRDGNMTDERNCPDTTCPPGYVKCPNNHICIFYTWACDGDNDCGDNGDEQALYCHGQDCPESSYRCNSGACIPSLWQCDDEADCLDGEDEDPDVCTIDRTCPTGYFTCDNGNCIPVSWKCDTDNDCGDGSDEADDIGCEDHTCDPEYYTCGQNRPGRTRCIPRDWICDGDSDCEDGDDESVEIQGCVRTTCDEGYHTCDNGLCIPDQWKCDHDNDCGDGTDEGNFCTYPTCTDNEFSCTNGRCIPGLWQCDGDNDCRDNSDELRCVTVPPTCPPDKYQCKTSGECIDKDFVCNKRNECNDGSDEFRCDIDECAEIQSNQCEYNCIDTTNSYYCECQQGYTLNDDGKTCRDVDECNETMGVCSQECENTRGAYICKCADGYLKEPDGKTCKQTTAITPKLIFSNRYYIRQLSIDGSDYKLIKDGFNNIVALDYDYAEEKIYFTDNVNNREKLLRINMDGSDLQTIYDDHDNIPNIQGLGIDWVGRKMYWTDADRDMIEVAELNGTNRAVLYHQGMSLPRAVAIDPRESVLFWTDWGLQPYIGRIDLDGNNPTKLDSITKLTWPNGLTIYYPVKKIFWIDAHLNYIGYANYDGSGFRELTGTADVAHPFALSVFEDQVYWTDWNDLAIHTADKWTLANKTKLVEILHRPMDIQVYHPLRQNQSIANPCGTNNGGCSHLCLLSNDGGYTCKCPSNFQMQSDLKTCTAHCNAFEFICADRRQCIPLQYRCDGEPDCADGSDEYASCPVRHCDRGLFQCTNLECTYAQYMCDGDDDCTDASDEQMCENTHCQDWEFLCGNGRCIPHFKVCDQSDDCRDNSDEDEQLCLSRTCSPGFFQCENGFCIPDSWFCDFDNDCGDNSDEPHRTCQQQTTCPPGWERCATNYRCIPSWAFCDGYDNCRDNSDESNCHQRTCAVGEFQCDNHRCIPGRWKCDHDNDCQDNSDEQDCNFRACSESEWRCPSTGKCIRNTWICDHDDDCEDGADELNCEDHTCAGDNQFQCASGHCINADYVCDGDRDCQDMSDELNCGTRLPGGLYCTANEFTCNNHLCIPRGWACDGDNDCGDDAGDGISSDETLSICATRECDTTDSFHCTNGKCIARWRLCDGVDNCGDSSDENNHDICSPPAECSDDEFKCANGRCVSVDYVCNDLDDCGDQTDERGCHKDQGSCASAGCAQVCTDIEGGFYCSCNQGLNITADRTGCEDIDECDQNVCMQKCSNSKGSYRCECNRGYTDTGSSGLDCKANGEDKQILFTDGPEIRVYNYASKDYNDVINHEGRIDAIDYSGTTLYWLDAALRALKRTSMPPVGTTTVSDNLKIDDINRPQDISVDWIAQNMYWTDQGDDDFDRRAKRDTEYFGPRISVAKTDGRYVRMLIINDLDKPGAIAVNPRRGVMYWTDYGETPKIEMAYMDGSHRKVIVSDRLSTPTGLSIDFASDDKVYFCDMKESLIEVMNWDGTSRRIILSKDLQNPFRVEVFETQVYWTTGAAGESGSILKQDKLGRGILATEIRNINLPQGIKMYQEQRYNLDTVTNPCENSKCSHLCLLKPGRTQNSVTDGFTCACPDNDLFKVGSTTSCQGAREEARPLPSTGGCYNGGSPDGKGQCNPTGTPGSPTESPNGNCQCKNNGLCNHDNKCICPEGFSGTACERSSYGKRTGGGLDGGALAGIFVIIIIVLVAVIALMFYYIRRRSRYNVKENGEGPVSYRGGTNIDLPGPVMPENGTSGNGFTEPGFQNPVYETSSPTLQAVGAEPEKTGLPIHEVAVDVPEKTGPPEGGIDASLPMPEVDLPPPNGIDPPTYTPTEDDGDTNVLVTKDKD